MTDLNDLIHARLAQTRLPGLDLGSEFTLPAYQGYSILSLPGTICRLLGVPPLTGNLLSQEILSALENLGEVQRVVFILIDALSYHRFNEWSATPSPASIWRTLPGSLLLPLTSVTPSTTSAALSTLWTGRSPAEHGIAGYELWLKEYGLVANMISHIPMSYSDSGSPPGSLAYAGFKPETFLPYPTLGTHLAAHGIRSYAFQHYSIARSGLSRMFFQEVEISPVSTAADQWVTLRRLLESRPAERQFCWVYLSEIDHQSHFAGPDDEQPRAQLDLFSQAFESLFLRRLSPAMRGSTLLILTADHGQILTRFDPHYDLRNHPHLVRRLHMLPTGENRLAYLFIKPGQTEAVREYIERTWPNQFTLLDPVYAVEAGLFGPGQPHPRLLDRLGDLLLVSRGPAYLWWGGKDNPLTGRHGGLSPEEMRVPFMAARV